MTKKPPVRVERVHHVTESGTHLVWLTVFEKGNATWEIEGFGSSEIEADKAAGEKLTKLAVAHGWKFDIGPSPKEVTP